MPQFEIEIYHTHSNQILANELNHARKFAPKTLRTWDVDISTGDKCSLFLGRGGREGEGVKKGKMSTYNYELIWLP